MASTINIPRLTNDSSVFESEFLDCIISALKFVCRQKKPRVGCLTIRHVILTNFILLSLGKVVHLVEWPNVSTPCVSCVALPVMCVVIRRYPWVVHFILQEIMV